jgi:Zn-dependent M28 family amino/carboxypeptidase
MLASTIGDRNIPELDALNEAAAYIRAHFEASGFEVIDQVYAVGETSVKNIEATLTGTESPDEYLVIGAHYDSVVGCPGANDNASGVAALLAISRELANRKLPRSVRFVAFVNEEPPYFQTANMGSVVYAQAAKKRGDDIVGMLSLETIGYYSDSEKSQHYPPPFNLFYPSTGNFIAFVGNMASRKLVRRCVKHFRRSTQFPSEGVAAPGWITGIGWSDQWAFWQAGYPALMVTDTAPFRYAHYHTIGDTPEKLHYEHTARVVAGLVEVVAALAAE